MKRCGTPGFSLRAHNITGLLPVGMGGVFGPAWVELPRKGFLRSQIWAGPAQCETTAGEIDVIRHAEPAVIHP
jgi:hypothetical protein